MPKLSLDQDVAIKIVDFIYFYDVLSLQRFSITGEDEQFFKDMNILIDKVLRIRKKTGLDAMLYKHFLLCGLEICASFNDEIKEGIDPNIEASKIKKFLFELHKTSVYKLFSEVERQGIDEEYYLKDLNYLLFKLKVKEVPNSTCFQLVATALTYDFDGCISAQVYKKFLELNIISTNKNNQKSSFVVNDELFLRAILFIEFEIMRNKIYHKQDKPVFKFGYLDDAISEIRQEREEEFIFQNYLFVRKAVSKEHVTISKVSLLKKDEIKEYLLNIKEHLPYINIFSEKNSKWATLFGLWYLYSNQGNDFSITGSSEKNKMKYIAEATEIMKSDFGMSVGERSIFDMNGDYEEFIAFIEKFLYELRNQEKTVFPRIPLAQSLNYHGGLSESLLKIYDDFYEKIK